MSAPVFPNIVQLAVPAFTLAIAIEVLLIRYAGRKGRYETRDALTSLIMGVGNVAVGLFLGLASYAFLSWLYGFRINTIGFEWWAIAIAFVLDDLRYYWAHRFYHRCRWGWAAHVVHHSSQHYNLTTALRQTWTGLLTGVIVLYIPLVLIGFHPAVLVFVFGVNLVYQFWIHTEVIDRMPRWFEAVMNTPSHHRVHHGTNARYLDANYAGVFIVWDRLFGTFVPELKSEPVRYGIIRNLATFNPLRVAFHEYIGIFRDIGRRGLSLKQRLLYIIAPPGWSHDGRRQSTGSIKRDYVARHPEEAGAPGLPSLSTANSQRAVPESVEKPS